MVLCTSALPNVRSPTSRPRVLSRSAPATISLALAELRLTSTSSGRSPATGSASVRKTRRSEWRPSVTTTVEPSGRNAPAMPTASSSSPPGSPRRSSTSAWAPRSRRLVTVSRSASVAPRENWARAMYPIFRPSRVTILESTAGTRMRARVMVSSRGARPRPDADRDLGALLAPDPGDHLVQRAALRVLTLDRDDPVARLHALPVGRAVLVDAHHHDVLVALRHLEPHPVVGAVGPVAQRLQLLGAEVVRVRVVELRDEGVHGRILQPLSVDRLVVAVLEQVEHLPRQVLPAVPQHPPAERVLQAVQPHRLGVPADHDAGDEHRQHQHDGDDGREDPAQAHLRGPRGQPLGW